MYVLNACWVATYVLFFIVLQGVCTSQSKGVLVQDWWVSFLLKGRQFGELGPPLHASQTGGWSVQHFHVIFHCWSCLIALCCALRCCSSPGQRFPRSTPQQHTAAGPAPAQQEPSSRTCPHGLGPHITCCHMQQKAWPQQQQPLPTLSCRPAASFEGWRFCRGALGFLTWQQGPKAGQGRGQQGYTSQCLHQHQGP